MSWLIVFSVLPLVYCFDSLQKLKSQAQAQYLIKNFTMDELQFLVPEEALWLKKLDVEVSPVASPQFSCSLEAAVLRYE